MNGRRLNDSLLNFSCRSLRFLRFIRSQDSIAYGALGIACLQLATGIRPVGRKAHNRRHGTDDDHPGRPRPSPRRMVTASGPARGPGTTITSANVGLPVQR